MINKVKTLVNLWKTNGLVGKIFSISELENGDVECIIDRFGIEPVYMFMLARVLKQRGLNLSQINPVKPNRLQLVFEEDNNG